MSRTLRTGKINGASSITSSFRRSVSRLTRAVERAHARLLNAIATRARRPAVAGGGMQDLEPRRLFNATLDGRANGGEGQFTLVDTANAAQPAVIMFRVTGGAGVATALVATTDNGAAGTADTVTGITVTLAGDGPFVVDLSSSSATGPVVFTGYNPGAQITLNLLVENVVDGDAGGAWQPASNSNGAFTQVVARNVVDTSYDGTAVGALANNFTSTKAATADALGNVTLNNFVVGALTLRNIGAANNTGTNVTVDITTPGTIAATGLTIATEGGMGVRVGPDAGDTIVLNGAGGVAISSVTGPLGNVLVGNVTATVNAAAGSGVSINANTTLGAVTFGNIRADGDAAGDQAAFTVQAGTTVGQVTFGDVTASGTFSGGITIGAGTTTSVAGIGFGNVKFDGPTGNNFGITIQNTTTLGALSFASLNVTGAAQGDVLVGTTVDSVTSLSIPGGVNFSTTGSATLNLVPGAGVNGGVGSVGIGSFTAQLPTANNVQPGSITIAPTGPVGAITIGAVTVGDAGDNDTAFINVAPQGANQNVTSVNITGPIILAGANSNTPLQFSPSGTGTLGTVSLGAITALGDGEKAIIFGSATASSLGTIALGNITLGGPTVDDEGNLTLTFNADVIGALTATGTWNVGVANASATNGSVLSVNVTGNTGAASNNFAGIVGNALDINVNSRSSGTIAVTARDGVGQVTINTIDLISEGNGANRGTLSLTVNANNNNDETGAFTGLTVSAAGNDRSGETVGTSDLPGVSRLFTNLDVSARGIGAVSLAGGANSIDLIATVGDTQTNSTVGALTFGAGGVSNSEVNGLVVRANAGVGAVNVLGVDSTLLGADIDANVNNDTIGSLGAVAISGSGGRPSLTGPGFRAANFGPVSVTTGDIGDFSVNAANPTRFGGLVVDTSGLSAVATQALRNTTSNSIGTITVTEGRLAITNLQSDDGIGQVNVDTGRNTTATAFITTINTSRDTVAGQDPSGGLTGITSGGTLTIGTIDTDDTGLGGTNAFAGAAVGNLVSNTGAVNITTLLDVAGNVGTIAASTGILLQSVIVNGNLPLVTIGGFAGVTNPSTTVTETISIPSLVVRGSVGSIIGGLGLNGGANNDTVIIGGGTIGAGLGVVNAGQGTLTITGLTINNDATTGTGSLYQLTGTNTDFIVDVRGAGTNALFDTTVTIASAGNTSSVSVNDIRGVTNNATVLSFATRLNTVLGVVQDYNANGLGVDNSPRLFSVGSIQDAGSVTVPADRRHSFLSVLIEGNLNGDIGAVDGTLLDNGNAVRNELSSNSILNAPILGDIGSIIITGNWANAAGEAGSEVYVRSLGSFSFGSTSVAITQDIGTNNNNSREDLEVFTALTPLTQANLAITPADGASITTLFAGPTATGLPSLFETFRTTDNSADGVLSTVVLQFTAGVITQINTFGQRLGLEYAAARPALPATSPTTTISYGVAVGTFAATNVIGGATDGIVNAIDYISFSSAIGDITVLDVDVPNAGVPVAESSDRVGVGLGDVFVGYNVNVNGSTDVVNSVTNYFRNPGNGTSNGLQIPTTGAAGAVTLVRGGVGNILVQGSLGAVLASGNVGSITTEDNTVDARIAALGATAAANFGIADFLGLVTDGTVGAITVEGDVIESLVAGDGTILGTGPDGNLGGGDDVFGFNIAPDAQAFLGAISVSGGDIGSTSGGSDGSGVTVTGSNITGFSGTVISAPFGINVAINVTPGVGNVVGAPATRPLSSFDVDAFDGAQTQGRIISAIISGAQNLPLIGTVNTQPAQQTQENDDLAGNITAVSIFGDIFSGDDISSNITATGLLPYAPSVVPATASTAVNNALNLSGRIGSLGNNVGLLIIATGASTGDITGNILAAGDMIDVTVQAGTGTGGSILGNVIAGTDGSGSITSDFDLSQLLADDDIGAAANTHVVSASNSIFFDNVISGRQLLAGADGNIVDGGDINSDFAAGVLLGTVPPAGAGVPQTANFNSANLPLFTNASNSLVIGTLQAGINGDALILNSDINGTFVAARNVVIDNIFVDGDLVGNNGVVGGHAFVAGLGFIGTLGNGSQLSIDGGTVVGVLSGAFASGTFANTTLPASPFNANDLSILRGTVLSYGDASINLTVGQWNPGSDITLPALLAGTVNPTVSNFVPNFAVGATGNIALDIFAQGLPFVAPQTGAGTISPNPASGDVVGISVFAFGGLSGSIGADNSADINFTLSNVDAITAIDTNTQPGNPSSPATNRPLNTSGNVSGVTKDNALSVNANGNGTGGLVIDYALAGFDVFTASAGTTAFYSSFGLGNLSGNFTSSDAARSNGLEVGDITFFLLGAGENISSSLNASDDVVGLLGGATTDGATLFPAGLNADGDIVAGLSAIGIVPGLNPTGIANTTLALFPGGDNSVSIFAGDDIGTTANQLFVTALAGVTDIAGAQGQTNGNIGGEFISGVEDQINDADRSSDIVGVFIAAGSVSASFNAGDATATADSGKTGGDFIGGIHAGAGNDLDINAAGDNIVGADISGNILTVGSVDVTGLGLLSEDAISGSIRVGFGLAGGNFLGNIVAEGNINELSVWGNVGTSTTNSLIYGGSIGTIVVGNSPFAANLITGANRLRPASLYTGGFGTLNAEVYSSAAGDSETQILVGNDVSATSTILLGGQSGINSLLLGVSGSNQAVNISSGSGLVFVSGALLAQQLSANGNTPAAPVNGVIDVLLRSSGVTLTSNQFGALGLGLRDILAGDVLGSDNTTFAIDVNDGSLRSVEVNDDVDAQVILNGFLAQLPVLPSSFSFVANSLAQVSPIVQAFNNDVLPIGLIGGIQVDHNIGQTGTGSFGFTNGSGASLGAGLNAGLTNWAIKTQGDLGNGSGPNDDIISGTGSVGNMVIGGRWDAETVNAYVNVGSVFSAVGSNNGNYVAQTGSVGFISAEDNIAITVDASVNFLGAQARTGEIDGITVDVNGSIGLLLASGDIENFNLIAETGSVGIDLDLTDRFVPAAPSNIPGGPFGIFSLRGPVRGFVSQIDTNNTNLVPTFGGSSSSFDQVITGDGLRHAYVSKVSSQIVAGGSVGNIGALGDLSNFVVTAGGNVGNLTSIAGRVGGAERLTFTVTERYDANTGNVSHPTDGVGTFTGTGTFTGIIDLRTQIAVEQGVLWVVARGAVGSIDSMLSVGTAPVTQALSRGPFTVHGGLFVTSNANLNINPETLEFDLQPLDPTLSTGIGNVFSRTGDINATLVTSGNIGFARSATETGTPVGGIAAPLGNVNVDIRAGGSVGGINGRTVTLAPGSVVSGQTGVPTAGEEGTFTTDIGAGSPLVLTVGGVTYVVRLTAANGSVTYTIKGTEVTFDSVRLTTTGPGAGVEVFTTSGNRSAVLAGTATRDLSPVLTSVTSLTAVGNLSNIVVDGELTGGTIAGNLTGSLDVSTLGSLAVSGNIGTANVDNNPFAADGFTLRVGSGSFGSLTAGGTNFGLQTVTISKGSYLSWANTLSSGLASSFLNAYVRTGSAVLTINNGFLQGIALGSGTTSGLLVFASGTTFDTATDAVPTAPRANVDNDRVLAAYATGGSLPRGTSRPTFKGDNGANVANVGTISGAGLNRLTLNQLTVEGSVGTLLLPQATSSVSRMVLFGGLANANVAGTISNADIRGNSGVINAGTVTNLLVSGNLDKLTVGTSISGARITGNAAVVTSGGSLRNLRVDGSSIQISARSGSQINVGGSVGVQVAGPTSALSLGQVFSAEKVASVLGLSASNLADSADAGPNGTKFLGGLNISLSAANVTVGGLISDLVFGRIVNTNVQNFLGQTVDDAYVGVFPNKFFQKENGVVVRSA
jgi:hypothetical protein